MADADTLDKEDIAVVIDAPEPEKKDDVVVKTEAKESPAVKDPAIKELTDQYKELQERDKRSQEAKADAQRRAQAAEADAAKARREAAEAKAQVVDSNIDTITTALQSAQARADAAKREIKAAGEAGDYGAQTEAFDKLATAKAEILRYDEAKADLETRKSKKADEPVEAARPSDPVEAFIANRTEPTANWLRAHKDFITDQRKNAKLTSAHWNAVGEGLAPDTDEYFEHVEKFLGLKKDDAEVEVKVKEHTRKAATRPVAPVNASGGSGNGSGGTEVRLTAREAAAATDGTHVHNYSDPNGKFKKGDPIGVQEFARRKKAMMDSGVYDRTYTDQ